MPNVKIQNTNPSLRVFNTAPSIKISSVPPAGFGLSLIKRGYPIGMLMALTYDRSYVSSQSIDVYGPHVRIVNNN